MVPKPAAGTEWARAARRIGSKRTRLANSVTVVRMTQPDQDPSASTQQFRAFANRTEGDQKKANTPLIIGVVAVVVVVLIVIALIAF
jgi:hypothetical protein